MSTYADSLGVHSSLEDLAKWVSWADSAHYAQNDQDARYNLNQFWAAKGALDAATTAAHINDLVFLDALSHRVMGYIYMRDLVFADPYEMADLTAKMQEQFSLASSEFAQSGHAMEASHDALRAGQAEADAAQIEENYVDDSITTAVKDRYNEVLDTAGSVLTSAGGVLGLLKSPLILAGLAAGAAYMLWKRV